jgi:hypothetical protein
MPYTQTDLDKITKSIATGAMQAMINGESVTFRSLEEMRGIKRDIERALHSTAAAPFQTRYPSTADRGL